jgi:hypothetical protein
LSVVVQPFVQNGTLASETLRKANGGAPDMASGTDPVRMTKGAYFFLTKD